MAVGVGLLAGIGLFLIWWSCWDLPTRPPREKKTDPVLEVLRRAGIEKVGTLGLLASCLLSGFLIFLLVFLMAGSIPIAFCFGVFGAALPALLVRRRALRRAAVLGELWPDVVDHLRSAIRAGLSLSEGLIQLGENGPEELRRYFLDFAADYRSGGHFDPALERLKERLSDPIADRIFAALQLARDVGGSDLGRLLGTLADFLRESARTRSELAARQSWTVNAARLAVAAPWVVLALLTTQQNALDAYNSSAGWTLLLSGLAVSIFCYRVMLRIGALPEEERVLR